MPETLPPPSLDRLCLHTFTTRPWSAEECIEHYAAAGVRGVSWWQETVAGKDRHALRRSADDAGLSPVSYVRGGFFTGDDAARAKAAGDNRRCLDEAAELGCPLLVLVPGATPGQRVGDNLKQVEEGIQALLPEARSRGIKLAIEPLHPQYAPDRSCVNSVACGNWLCNRISDPSVGLAIDAYHVWWEHDLAEQLWKCGRAGRLLAYHVCDHKREPSHPLLDRGLMGEGVIDLHGLRRDVEAAGFGGFIEVEVFSLAHWGSNQHDYLKRIVEAYRERA